MELRELPLDLIQPDPEQPRKEFDLTELKQSIHENGVLVPIIVQPNDEEGESSYIIIDGERRYRSSTELGLKHIPAVINVSQKKDWLKDQLIIDHQRHSLTVEEKSSAWTRLLEQYQGSYDEVATAVGVSVSQVKNVIEGAQFKARVKDQLPEDLGWRERAVIRRTNRIKDDNIRARLVLAAIENNDGNKLIDEKVQILSEKALDEKRLSPAEQKIIIEAKDVDEAIISIRNMREELMHDAQQSALTKAKQQNDIQVETSIAEANTAPSYPCPYCGSVMNVSSGVKRTLGVKFSHIEFAYECEACAALLLLPKK